MALTGRVAVVTGAARGIGRAIAEELAAGGANLALCDLDKDWLADTAKAVKDMGREVCCVSVNVADGDAVKTAVAEVVENFGRIDILVNNAGITKDTLLLRMSEDQWNAVLDVNLKGTFLFTKAAARVMMKQKSGSIVNIASVIGLMGNAGQANYAASKAGVIALAKSAAREFAGWNIRVNSVAPGFIETKMTEVLPEEVKAKLLEMVPAKRLGSVQDVARAVSFLAGDNASYITGQVLTVDGGMVM